MKSILEMLYPKTIKPTDDLNKQTDILKSRFEFWDEWTGGRWQRVRNPFLELTDRKWRDLGLPYPRKKPKRGSVIRSNPVNGGWDEVFAQDKEETV